MPGRIPARRMDTLCRAVLFGAALGLASGAAYSQSRGDPARGGARVAACDACHGAAGRPSLPGTPTLAGQQEEYLVLQLILLREGLRDVPQMAGVLKGWQDRDLQDVAAHYGARQPLRGGEKRDPQLFERGAGLAKSKGCTSCHGDKLDGQQHVPRLAGQREDYLAASLTAYRDGKRTGVDTSMNAAVYGATDAEIRALAHFLAHQ
jgi:cytochrome c553